MLPATAQMTRVMLHGDHVANQKTSTASNVYLDGAGNMARVEAGTMAMRFSNFEAPVSVVAPMYGTSGLH